MVVYGIFSVTTIVALADKSPCILVDDAAEEDDPPSPPSDEGALFAPKSTSIQPLRSGGGRGARGPTRDRIGKNLGEER